MSNQTTRRSWHPPFTLPPLLIEVGASESCELLNSFWMGPSGSQHPNGVQGPHIQTQRSRKTVFIPRGARVFTPRSTTALLERRDPQTRFERCYVSILLNDEFLGLYEFLPELDVLLDPREACVGRLLARPFRELEEEILDHVREVNVPILAAPRIDLVIQGMIPDVLHTLRAKSAGKIGRDGG